jgi:uncharacterized protein YhaN
MKIRRLSIDGYGRFAGQDLECEPGLQVILGPNERGKSTLRAFIGDMLYGQKRLNGITSYEEGHDLRTPWENPDCYGGRLSYELSDGRTLEVVRNFDKKRELVQVLDTVDGRDITSEFELLRSGDLDFALRHLGLSKEVFLSTATITHLTLEELGDQDALEQIRQKLVALADSGEEDHSSESALARLKERISAIGQPQAKNRPLPQLEMRLAALQQELLAAQALQRELSALAQQRRRIQQESGQFRKERLALEQDLRTIEAHEHAARLRDAENLLKRIDTATQHCFALAAVRDFPMDQMPHVHKAEKALAAARLQLDRSREEAGELKAQLEAERRRLGKENIGAADEVPRKLVERLEDLDQRVAQLRARLTEVESDIAAGEVRLEGAQEAVAAYPDFSRIAPDPVEWLSQLASSFSVAVRSRDEEEQECRVLRAEIAEREQVLRPYQKLFGQVHDFPKAAREYELRRRIQEEQQEQGTQTLQTLQSTREDIAEELPGFRSLGAINGVLAAALIGAWAYWQVTAILIPAGLFGLGAAWFLSNFAYGRTRLRKFDQQIEQTTKQMDVVDRPEVADAAIIDMLIEQAGCDSLRELEGRYDAFRDVSAEVSARKKVLETQEERAAEATDRVVRMLERFHDTFERVGESVAGEEGVAEATARAIGRYQEYREAKRGISDARTSLDRLQAERKALAGPLEAAEQERSELVGQVREILRRNGFEAASSAEQIREVIKEYAAALSTAREQRARLDILGERHHNLERQVKREELEFEKHEQELAHLLARAGVSSIEQWNAMADQAREYRDVWNKRAALQEQFESLLPGEAIQDLRKAVAADGDLPPAPRLPREEVKEQIDALNWRIDGLLQEEHALHLRAAEMRAGTRARNEIEEERAWVERRRDLLLRERDAASYAMALIESIAHDKHARIAPVLARIASKHLVEITGGAYKEVRLGPDLRISVRIPQTKRMEDHPEKTLSKGTVDQIYLALRLALVEAMSEQGEPLPMLLDDPFANYDDGRLLSTMKLIHGLAERHQILLFTCREDVARAAEQVNAAIVRL